MAIAHEYHLLPRVDENTHRRIGAKRRLHHTKVRQALRLHRLHAARKPLVNSDYPLARHRIHDTAEPLEK